MLGELRSETIDLNIEIVGLNQVGYDFFNARIRAFSLLPWLQQTAAVDVESLWNAAYRDVLIVSPEGEQLAVFNLTSNDLTDPENFQEFKAILRNAAQATDTDGDGLRDDWERKHFAGLEVSDGGETDIDGDGASDFTEFCGESDPNDPRNRPAVTLTTATIGGETVPAAEVSCAAGEFVALTGQVSRDLSDWSSDLGDVREPSPRAVEFDGNGTARAVFTLGPNFADAPQWWIRLEGSAGAAP